MVEATDHREIGMVKACKVHPCNIGLGATPNPALVEQAARVTAQEILGTNIRRAFGSCVAVGGSLE